MSLWKTEKYLRNLYLVVLFLFYTGFSFAADPEKVDTRYIEMSKGYENAQVVLVEYASLTCSHCAEFHTKVYPKLNKEYIDTGKIKFVHREIYFDKAGLWAALTARCSDEVNRYFGMLDLLYSEQSMWSKSESSDDIVDGLLRISAKAGIEKGRAISCLEDQQKAVDLVNQMQSFVKVDSIESTPTFLINGKKYGNMPYEELKKIIEKELSR